MRTGRSGRPKVALAVAILGVLLFLVTSGLGVGPAGSPGPSAAPPRNAAPTAARGPADGGPATLDRAARSLAADHGPVDLPRATCTAGTPRALAPPCPPRAAPSGGGSPLGNVSVGPQWENVTGPVAPSPRAWASMTDDVADGYVLFFGGLTGRGTFAKPLNDTWAFADGNWTELHPPTSPSARYSASMVYDPVDGYVVLFGGWYASGSGHPIGETWAFHAGVWTNLSPATSPPARASPALAFDAADGYVLLFGGENGLHYFNDTWGFRGGTWTNLTTTHAPSARDQIFLSDDPRDGYVLLFGGQDGGSAFWDTWTYDGGKWTELFPTTSPSPHATGGMLFDPATDSVVLFGGYDAGIYYNDTWGWANGTWTEFSEVTGPDPRSAFVLALDPTDHGPMVFGGNPQTLSEQRNDTWLWTSPWELGAADPDLADVGQTVVFSVTATDPAGRFSYSWGNSSSDLGCAYSTSSVVACTPDAPGNYTAFVNVTDNESAWSLGGIPYEVYPDPTVLPPTSSRPEVDSGQSALLSARASGGTGVYLAFRWSGLGSARCDNVSLGVLNCTFVDPMSYSISVSVTDSAGVTSASSGSLRVAVLPRPTLTVPVADRASIDVGQNVTFTTSIPGVGSGGDVVAWSSDSPNASCPATGGLTETCLGLAAGSFEVGASVTDSNGGVGTVPSAPVTIVGDPVTFLPKVSPSEVDLGGSVAVSVTAVGGAGNLSYSWSGLPDGCLSTDASFECVPGAAGNFTVRATATDENGFAAVSSPVPLRVDPPLAGTLQASATNATTSENLSFAAHGSGGSGSYRYSWSFGDGSGATGPSTQHAFRTAGRFVVRVWINDTLDSSVVKVWTVTVSNPPPPPAATFLGLPPSEGLALVAGIAIAVGVSAGIVGLRRRSRTRPDDLDPSESSSD